MIVNLKHLIEVYGTQKKLALVLGVKPNYVSRWISSNAMIDTVSGNIYFKRAEKVKPISEELPSNVKKVDFGTSYKILEDVERDILQVAMKYDGQIPLASFIGVLDIVKAGFLQK